MCRRAFVLCRRRETDCKTDAFSRRFANVYRAAMLARVNDEIAAANATALENWFRSLLESHVPYDRMVRELIGDETPKSGESASSIYYRINDNKPENLAANTSSLFLGIKLECAQCHDDRSGTKLVAGPILVVRYLLRWE